MDVVKKEIQFTWDYSDALGKMPGYLINVLQELNDVIGQGRADEDEDRKSDDVGNFCILVQTRISSEIQSESDCHYHQAGFPVDHETILGGNLSSFPVTGMAFLPNCSSLIS